MGGRFSNIQYNETVDSLISTIKKATKNNYYKYSDKPPTPVEYYHINKEASTLDESAQIAFNSVGEDSPFIYNHIRNMMLYGVDQVALQYTNDEFGVEAEPIEGDAVILPNTIEPYPDDQFIIKYDNSYLVFKIVHVDPDTLEDGSNAYKIQFRASTSTKQDLEKQVIEDFELIITNVGTNFNPILKTDVVDYIKELDCIIVQLKQYFKRLFYNKRVQTFTFKYLEDNFYDPYLVEFIRKNNILDNDGEYIYIQHQTTLDPLFPMNYGKTIFSFLEKKDINHVDGYTYRGVAKLIENKFTIFVNRMEEYWEVYYDYPEGYEFLRQIPCFRDEFIDHVSKAELFETRLTFYNIILKYLYDKDIIALDLHEIEKINYENNPTLFYAIPCIIFCLERSLNKLLSINHSSEKH